MNDYERQRIHRTMIFQENERIVRGPFPHSNQYDLTPQISHTLQSPNITYFQQSTNDGIMHFCRKGKRVCALNFANASHVGGGVVRGAIAQEETLCLTSPALYHSLAALGHSDGQGGYVYNSWGSPNWNRCIIETTNVLFIRDNSLNRVHPYTAASIITAAAPNNKHTPIARALQDADQIENVIRNMLALTYGKGYDVLVLGAWGCGAFAPEHDKLQYTQMVASVFRKVLSSFPTQFETICFSIPDQDKLDIFRNPGQALPRQAQHRQAGPAGQAQHRPICKYAPLCYQRSPEHWATYDHLRQTTPLQKLA